MKIAVQLLLLFPPLLVVTNCSLLDIGRVISICGLYKLSQREECCISLHVPLEKFTPGKH